MVRFIRYWIERAMEDPEEREEKIRKHVETVSREFKPPKTYALFFYVAEYI